MTARQTTSALKGRRLACVLLQPGATRLGVTEVRIGLNQRSHALIIPLGSDYSSGFQLQIVDYRVPRRDNSGVRGVLTPHPHQGVRRGSWWLWSEDTPQPHQDYRRR
jgi:hypothetical protein